MLPSPLMSDIHKSKTSVEKKHRSDIGEVLLALHYMTDK